MIEIVERSNFIGECLLTILEEMSFFALQID